MAPTPKTPSFLPDWDIFRKNLPADHPFERLLPDASAAGFDFDLEQLSAVGLADASVLVTFMVHIGKDGKFEPYRQVSMHLLSSIGPVTLAARLQVNTTLIHMFFGRLPDQAPTQTVDVGRAPIGDIVLPEEPETEEQEYVEDSAPISRRAAAEAAKMPSLIDHLEPDGVPVFRDLDDIPDQFSTAEIIAQFLTDVDAAAVKFSSAEQVLALFTKNAEAVDFLKELGSPDDRTALKGLLDKHQARLEAAGVVREVKIPGGKGSTVQRRRRAA